MAQQRATIVAHALDDAHIDLTPTRDRRTPVGVPSASDLLKGYHDIIDVHVPIPETSATTRRMVTVPLPTIASNETILEGFASLRPAGKRERMVPYPIRLPAAQIASLERLRDERGIIPAEFIRDAVASCLALLLGS